MMIRELRASSRMVISWKTVKARRILVAPNEMFAEAFNRNLNLQRFKVLYICGNYSSILSRLDRRL